MQRNNTLSKHVHPRLNRSESRALAIGMQVLQCLTDSQRSMSLREISSSVGVGKPSTWRLLRTLERTGHIVRDDGDRYYVDHRWPTAKRLITLRALRTAAMPVLRQLNAEYGETVSLAFLFEDEIRVAEVLEGIHHIRTSNCKGRVLQPYASSLGKVIAAFQAPERIQTLLDVYGIYRFTPYTITDPWAIQEEFAAVREKGYSEDQEETVEGRVCFAAPIATWEGEVVAATSVALPKARAAQQLLDSLPEVMKESAKRIEVALRGPQVGAEMDTE